MFRLIAPQTAPQAATQAKTASRPRRKIAGKAIAALTALSIGFAGLGATPAQASKSDVAKTVAGLTLLFILGSAMSDSSRRTAPAPAPTPRWHPRPTPPSYPRYVRPVLPLQCVRWVDTARGAKRILGRRCIENRVGDVALPRQCKRHFWNARGQQRSGYGRNCLVNRGYRIAFLPR